MCGFVGMLGTSDGAAVRAMTRMLAHRGPDAEGFFERPGLQLGHRRLSIIDVAGGHQPMRSEDGRLVLVFNGMIYNFQSLREELAAGGARFRTRSDTEVVLEAYRRWGIECLARFNGEFVIALWDERTGTLLLARDRLGIRPLYYTRAGSILAFASELKAFLKLPGFRRDVAPDALAAYLELRYVPGQQTLFKSVRKFPPGAYALVTPDTKEIEPISFWSLDYSPLPVSDERELIVEFRALLEDAVRLRMISDVPIGAFLSGGLDSSAVVALMRRHSSRAITTFTIGFGTEQDELEKARRLAEQFDCDHHPILIGESSYDLLKTVVWHLDEPVGDAIVIPTFLLGREAARTVKAVVTGEGADELLNGYVHHQAFHAAAFYNRWVPPAITRALVLPLVRHSPAGLLGRLVPYPAALGPQSGQRAADFLASLDHPVEAFRSLASVFARDWLQNAFVPAFRDRLATDLVAQEFEPYFGPANPPRTQGHGPRGLFQQVGHLDLNHWLPNYTLHKQDRLAMANSLEGRVPFLDHRLVEFCTRVPDSLKLRGLTTKYLLRQACRDLLPSGTIQAKKKAFYFPYTKCFGLGFTAYVRDLLSPDRIRRRGIFDPVSICELAAKDPARDLVREKQLMSLLILEEWMRQYLD